MDIESHFDFLLEKYKLNNLYKKFIFLSVLTTTIKEGFYWSLIYFSEIVKDKPELITKFSATLIGMIGINIPFERYFNYIKAKLLKEIKMANTKYFNDRIIKMSKQELLGFDLVEYFNILEHFNENIQEYILNIKNKYDIPVRCMTLIVVAMNKKFGLLIGLFVVFYAIVKSMNENKLVEEKELTKKYFFYENVIRNYIINGKNFLINDEFNKEYLTNNFNKYEKVNRQIQELNNKLDMNVNVIMFAFIIIVIWARIKELNQYDFFYYFLIIYDVEFIADKVQEYYKNKVNYSKMQERLNYLNSFTPSDKKPVNQTSVKDINIDSIQNDKPTISITKPLVIKENEHILVTGESGSGKTSLLYVLKGIIKPDKLSIRPNIEFINAQTYLTLPNHKSLFSGNLYDIITNYEKTPNTKLIDWALKSSKIEHRINSNQFIDIETLSGGERIRLLITRIIYAVKTKNYNILLFDEIDENLNDELAQEICINLRDIFKDKIILYITHNEKVKQLFAKKFTVTKGVIESNI
jgi:ABC-type transport system involved in cytochrome bd biosynthesis fused ATPase/permease subunit